MHQKLTTLQIKLALLDAALTGKPYMDVMHTAQIARITEDDLLGVGGDMANIYYLSDGGYSRVVFSIDADNIRATPSNVSLDRVKQQWILCKQLVEDIIKDLAAYVKKQGW